MTKRTGNLPSSLLAPAATVLLMKDEQHRFLTLLGQIPTRLTAEQTAWVLGCQPHDVPILVASRLLKPLGNPPPNGIKFFATGEVLEQAKDRSWLSKITNTVNQHWQRKNARKKKTCSDILTMAEACHEH